MVLVRVPANGTSVRLEGVPVSRPETGTVFSVAGLAGEVSTDALAVELESVFDGRYAHPASVADEAARAEGVEASLAADIADEATARAAGDTANADALADEVAARSALEAALPATYAPIGSALDYYENVPLWVDGHSFTTTGASVRNFHERIRLRLLMAASTVVGVSGQRAEMMALNALHNYTTGQAPHLTVGICATNNAMYSDDPTALRSFEHAWRTWLSIQTAAQAMPANSKSYVYGPGWTTEASVDSSGGTRWVGGVGSEFTFTYNDLGGGVDQVFHIPVAGGAAVSFYADGGGAPVATVDLTAPVQYNTPAIARIRGLSVGTHTIKGVVTAGTARVDGYRVPATRPPRIVIIGEGGRDEIGNPYPYPGGIIPGTTGYNATLFGLLKPIQQALMAEFPTVAYVDLGNGNPGEWDPTIHAQDGLHPNDRGAAFILQRALAELAGLPLLPGTNRLDTVTVTVTVPAFPAIPFGGNDGTGANGLLVTAPSSTSLLADWTALAAPAGVTDYSVRYRTPNGSGAWTTTTSAGTGKTYTITGLTTDATYGVEVAPIVGGVTGTYTAEVVKKVHVPSIPTGFVHRYKAADNATAADTVLTASVADSGSGAQPLTGGAGLYPTKRVTSGKHWFEFDGVTNALTRTTPNVARPKWVFAVAKVFSTGSTILIGSSGASSEYIGITTGGAWAALNPTALVGPAADTNWHVIAVQWNNDGTASLYIDNSTTPVAVGAVGNNATQGTFYVARNSSGTCYHVGIADLIEYPAASALTTQQIADCIDQLKIDNAGLL